MWSRSRCGLKTESRAPLTTAFARLAKPAFVACVLAGALLLPERAQAQTTVTNTASATFQTVRGTDSIISNTVGTRLIFPDVSVSKTLDGPSVARTGQTIAYTIGYGNASNSPVARDVRIVDTLAVPFEFISAQPGATVVGQIVTWDIGDLPAGASSEISLVVRVRDNTQDTVDVYNRAVLTGLNTAAVAAVASPVKVIGLQQTQLVLRKSSDVLEAGIGESVPYAVVLENTGVSPISDLWIFDELPAGTQFASNSLTGAEATSLTGRNLTLRVPGVLAPGASSIVRYAVAVVAPTGDVLANRAYATAENQFIRSDESVAWVRIRQHWPMETRTAIGKVWLDLDVDGVQDADEPGVEGVDVWTDDGEIATTDREGKYSFSNLRPGQHAFRLDHTTLPASHRVDDSGLDEYFKTFDVDGWTTPRVNFRVTPTAGTIIGVHLPLTVRMKTVPLCRDVFSQFPYGKPIVVAHFREGAVEPQFMIDPTRNRERLFGAMAASATCPVEIAGHTDQRSTSSAPADSTISMARARAVLDHFRRLELLGPYVTIRGYGSAEPAAQGTDVLARQLNRRVELKLLRSPTIEHHLELTNTNGVALDGMVIAFEPDVDSAVVLNGQTAIAESNSGSISLPQLKAGATLGIRAWSARTGDSVIAHLNTGLPQTQRLATGVADSSEWVEHVLHVRAPFDSLPSPETVSELGPVELVLAPAHAGMADMTFPLHSGWEPVDGPPEPNGDQHPAPALTRDRGRSLLQWRFAAEPPANVTVKLRPTGPSRTPDLRIATLRTDEDRVAEKRRALVAGPGVEIFDPVDGRVLPSDKLYVGVRGEAGTTVQLFSGDSVIADGTIRSDGIHDFIAIPLARGPNRLRVRMLNSWNQTRWDSIVVHVSGAPDRFEIPSHPVRLTADGHSVQEFRVRLVDKWGVPLTNPTYVSVEADGAQPTGTDEETTSVGMQFQSDREGWITVALKPGHEVGTGEVRLNAGKAVATIPLELLPAIRPLMITGVGRVGLGASPDPFGAVTARGRLDARTALVLSYDSRLLNAGQEAFGRSFDPLGDTQYPILGDAGNQRSTGASRYAFSARLERGFDWVALGDIPTTEFAAGLNLTTYRRALTGGAARFTTGRVAWLGFGSLTRRQVMQTQIRGAGASGPYQLERNIIVGTEEIALETRTRLNAGRILTRQVLTRFVDYQIDYYRGTLLFKRPVPAADAQENPVFIMVTYEAEGAGAQRMVGGMRATVDALGLVRTGFDSLRIGATTIRSDDGRGVHSLTGIDVRVLDFGALDVGAEVSYSNTPDSSGFAAAVDGGITLFNGLVDVAATWMKIDSGFGNPSKTSLRGGTEDIKFTSGVRLGASEFRVRHERQSFTTQGVERRRTHAGVVQRLGPAVRVDAGHASDHFSNGSTPDRSQAGEIRVTWTPLPSLEVWSEGRRQFNYHGNVIRPDHVAAGAAFQVNRHVSIEAQHRYVYPTDEPRYTVTNLGVRTTVGAGTQAWGSYQLAGAANGQYNAAVIGLNNQLRIGPALTLNALFERREGLDRASLNDPVRALPFIQAEENYWTAGLGVELLPPSAPYRISARGEYRNGDVRSSRLVTVAGDVSVSPALALLSRQELLHAEQQLSGTSQVSRRVSTLWGVAFRPVRSDAVNLLAKLQFVDESNPLGNGVLTRSGTEERLIGTTEVIWGPSARSELAWRYAMRRTVGNTPVADDASSRRESWADYMGARLRVDLTPWLALRTEGRLLLERTTNATRWDAAPSLLIAPVLGLEIGAGYRFGDLRDPDFAVRGGRGAFVTLGGRVTERVFPTALGFWKSRF